MQAVLLLGNCALLLNVVSTSWSKLENLQQTLFEKIVPFMSKLDPSLQLYLLHLKNEQVSVFCLPHVFLFALSEFLNPTVEKESNQWPR